MKVKSLFLRHNLKRYNIFIIFALALVSLIGVIEYHNMPLMQFELITILSIGYLSWALVHHSLDKSLTLEVILEYVLIAFLALIILYDLIV